MRRRVALPCAACVLSLLLCRGGAAAVVGAATLTGGDVSVAWSLDGDLVSFNVTSRVPSFAAGLGFGHAMLGSTAVVGWIDPDSGIGFVESYVMASKNAGSVVATGENLTATRVERSPSGVVSFAFTRSLAGGRGASSRPVSATLAPGSVALLYSLHRSWSTGVSALGSPQPSDEHFAMSETATLVNLGTGAAASAGVGRGLVAHASLMALAWGILFPGAALAARFLKPYGGAAFFYAHVGGISIGFVFLCVAFGLARAHVGGGEHYSSGHAKLGLAIFVMVWAQPANAYFRPHPPAPGEAPSTKRWAWELAHKNFGRALCGLGCVCVLSGITLVESHGGVRASVQAGQAMWVLWCALGLGAGAAALERQRRVNLSVGEALKV